MNIFGSFFKKAEPEPPKEQPKEPVKVQANVPKGPTQQIKPNNEIVHKKQTTPITNIQDMGQSVNQN